MTIITGTHNGSTGNSYTSYGHPGGAGGVGYSITANNYYYNETQITGGAGGQGGPGEYAEHVSPGKGGNGGAGVDISAGKLVNEANYAITGGGGGTAGENGTAMGGTGGVGVDISGTAVVVNHGSITGGEGGQGDGEPGGAGGPGGAGVYLNGGTLTNYGTISGGHHIRSTVYSDAVQFGTAAGTLIVEPGAQFLTANVSETSVLGKVAANSAVDDTLELAGTQSSSTHTTGITLGTQFTGFQTLDFASGASWTVDSTAASIDTSSLVHGIDGFTQSDTIDVTNLAFDPSGDSFNSSTDIMTLSNGSQVQFSNTYSGEHFVFTADASVGTDVTLADGPCFRRGTHIRSERGELPIESLKIGDRVATLSGEMRPIRWIGRRSYSGEVATGDSHVLPICIRTGALDEAVPKRDLWVSPEHAMYVNGMLIPAAALVNGESIIQEVAVDELTYIHLEFDGHTVIFAEGAPSESFVDDDSRQMFDNTAEYARLYPHASREPVRFCAPRVEEGWELQAVRQRLERRAKAAMGLPADGPDTGGSRLIPAAAIRTAGAAVTL
jgi:hypothetical protein